ncbi:thiamine-binding protein [bacterium]|nr:MAG: thiamine-binding protein [bacterium]
MAVVSVSVVPIGTGSTSVSPYVARCQEVLEGEEGIKFQLTPMATIIEGELDAVLDVIKKLHNVPFDEGAKRVLTTIIVDDRKDKPISMQGKLDSVRSKL